MKKSDYGIAHEGYPLLAFLALCSLVSALSEWSLLTLLFLAATFFTLHFFRDPERVTSQTKNIAVSPADGKIIRIQTKEDPITGEDKTCISIFMNVFSVHINRTPVEGVIKNIKYISGKYFNAAWDKASTDNERCAYLMQDADKYEWTFVQISGLVARRIVCNTEINDTLKRGERFGMIRFGSRVDVYLPHEYKVHVSIGDKVFAGESIIAQKQDSQQILIDSISE